MVSALNEGDFRGQPLLLERRPQRCLHLPRHHDLQQQRQQRQVVQQGVLMHSWPRPMTPKDPAERSRLYQQAEVLIDKAPSPRLLLREIPAAQAQRQGYPIRIRKTWSMPRISI